MTSRKFREDEFFELIESEKPKMIYWEEFGFFGTTYTFWFTGKDGIRNRMKIHCLDCFCRVRDMIQDMKIKVLKASYYS